MFDIVYRGFLEIEKDSKFEKVFYDTPRKSDEQYIAHCARKPEESPRYENDVGADLPDVIKGKILLRRPTWTCGSRRSWPHG